MKHTTHSEQETWKVRTEIHCGRCGGFKNDCPGITHSDSVEKLNQLIQSEREKVLEIIEKEIIGEDVDIQKVLNPRGTGAGQQYPGLIDEPSHTLVSALEGINEFKAKQRKKLAQLAQKEKIK